MHKPLHTYFTLSFLVYYTIHLFKTSLKSCFPMYCVIFHPFIRFPPVTSEHITLFKSLTSVAATKTKVSKRNLTQNETEAKQENRFPDVCDPKVGIKNASAVLSGSPPNKDCVRGRRHHLSHKTGIMSTFSGG